jgi:hypothetical protein
VETVDNLVNDHFLKAGTCGKDGGTKPLVIHTIHKLTSQFVYSQVIHGLFTGISTSYQMFDGKCARKRLASPGKFWYS